ncbi:hypothetical protein [Halorhabdus amylolytica]|uniref:hypothetical protein n=1 Tax=Halorhabdus amylolytica TaxID=2559573 RepID=UPI0010AB274C|nr:hypothetical protein [Halorhabdus amylolytica]
MDVATDDGEDNATETVLTFAGNGGRVYHKAVRMPDSELRPLCGADGRSLLEKERSLIESHYDPCRACFPGQDDDRS